MQVADRDNTLIPLTDLVIQPADTRKLSDSIGGNQKVVFTDVEAVFPIDAGLCTKIDTE